MEKNELEEVLKKQNLNYYIELYACEKCFEFNSTQVYCDCGGKIESFEIISDGMKNLIQEYNLLKGK